MKITEVRIRMVKKDSGKLKAVASITIDECFVVHDIKIIDNGDGDAFVAMPSRKGTDGEFKDIVHPLDSKTRDYIKSLIIEKYLQEKAL